MYDRWGLTNAIAAALTGVPVADLTDAVLDAAEDEIVDVIGWVPDAAAYDATTDVRARGFGRAVAWQAAHRLAHPASAEDGSGVRISSEGLGGDYSVSYAAGGVAADPVLAPRSRDLLVRGGWFRNVGVTAGSSRTRQAFDDWQRNRV